MLCVLALMLLSFRYWKKCMKMRVIKSVLTAMMIVSSVFQSKMMFQKQNSLLVVLIQIYKSILYVCAHCSYVCVCRGGWWFAGWVGVCAF